MLFPPMDARKNIEAIVAGGLGKYQRVLRKIKRASVPLMVDMSTKLKNVFTQLGENVVVVFAPGGKVDRKYKEALINSAIIARDQYDMYFAICNSKKEKTFLSYMGLSNEIPAIGIYNFETKAKYKFPTKKVSVAAIHSRGVRRGCTARGEAILGILCQRLSCRYFPFSDWNHRGSPRQFYQRSRRRETEALHQIAADSTWKDVEQSDSKSEHGPSSAFSSM